jgi:hypothetical protein
LVRIFPDPLIDLRDCVGRRTQASGLTPSVVSILEDTQTPRSPSRAASVMAAKERLRALTPEQSQALDVAESLERAQTDSGLDEALSNWADRWHLHALLDLAPHIVRYWAHRSAAARQFIFPVVGPILPSPRINHQVDLDDFTQPILADPDFESEREFVLRAKQHYQAREKELTVTPHHRRRTLREHAEWYVRGHVQERTHAQIAEAMVTETKAPDVSTITKGIQQFSELLSAPPVPPL